MFAEGYRHGSAVWVVGAGSEPRVITLGCDDRRGSAACWLTRRILFPSIEGNFIGPPCKIAARIFPFNLRASEGPEDRQDC